MTGHYRTSDTHPLRIDYVRSGVMTGEIGMTICPGKHQEHALSGRWKRDLKKDLERIIQSGATTLVTLIEDHEFSQMNVGELGVKAKEAGLIWVHLPIADYGTPDEAFERAWEREGHTLRSRLMNNEKIVLHCKGGLGRTGMIAARLLVELGEQPERAIKSVRSARPGTIARSGAVPYASRGAC